VGGKKVGVCPYIPVSWVNGGDTRCLPIAPYAHAKEPNNASNYLLDNVPCDRV